MIFSTFCLSLFSEFSSRNIYSNCKKKGSLKTTEVTYFKKKTQAEVHRFPSTGLAVLLTSWGICLHTVWGQEPQPWNLAAGLTFVLLEFCIDPLYMYDCLSDHTGQGPTEVNFIMANSVSMVE